MPDIDRWLADPNVRDFVVFAAVQLTVLLVATWIALRFGSMTVRTALTRLFAREIEEGEAGRLSMAEIEKRRDTLDGLVSRGLRIIILVIAFLMALHVLRFDIGPAIAGLGLLGLALSLGAQHLVRDYVAGAFVLIENQYGKGDVVRIAGIAGAVEDVSLRRTTLRDLDGTVHHVPHGLIETSSNLTRSWSRINLDLPVPFGTPYEQARRLIDEAGARFAAQEDWKAKVIEAPKVVRIDQIGESGLTLKVLGMVNAAEQWAAKGELRRMIIEAFEREGLALGSRPITDVALHQPDSERQQ